MRVDFCVAPLEMSDQEIRFRIGICNARFVHAMMSVILAVSNFRFFMCLLCCMYEFSGCL